jgi:multidrug efflux pump subunit AcrA (membrane-fusion protein)
LGEHVSPSDRQFVVADNKRMWIKLDVRQEEASRLRIGQRLTFAAEGLPEEIVSTVSWISTELDEQTRMLKVRAIVDNPRALGPTEGAGDMRTLRAQTFGTGRIRVDAVAQTLVVPKEAVQMDGTAALVFVQVGPQTFEARPVDVGIQGPGVAEVRHGLRMGEVVATAGSHSLKSELLRSASLQH